MCIYIFDIYYQEYIYTSIIYVQKQTGPSCVKKWRHAPRTSDQSLYHCTCSIKWYQVLRNLVPSRIFPFIACVVWCIRYYDNHWIKLLQYLKSRNFSDNEGWHNTKLLRPWWYQRLMYVLVSTTEGGQADNSRTTNKHHCVFSQYTYYIHTSTKYES